MVVVTNTQNNILIYNINCERSTNILLYYRYCTISTLTRRVTSLLCSLILFLSTLIGLSLPF